MEGTVRHTICVPTLRAREIISRLCFVLGPLRVFSANTRAESTSRRCSLYFLSEITLFLIKKTETTLWVQYLQSSQQLRHRICEPAIFIYMFYLKSSVQGTFKQNPLHIIFIKNKTYEQDKLPTKQPPYSSLAEPAQKGRSHNSKLTKGFVQM